MRHFALALVVSLLVTACDGRPVPPVPDEEPAVVVVERIAPIEIPPLIECAGERPVAILAPGESTVHVFDTVRLDASQSRAAGSDVDGSFVGEFEFTLLQRPVGSSASLFSSDSSAPVLEPDLPGRYVVQLHVHDVHDDGRVRSCDPAIAIVDALAPEGDLVAMLTWDHPTADLDLHTLREGGQPFTHEGDVYFSNREPVGAPWSDNPDENPELDVDDSEGYGPERTTVMTPVVGDVWTFAVHYWNQQTDGDAFTTARLSVYARSELVFDQAISFESEQVFWSGVEVRWTEDAPEVVVIDALEDFPRPF